MGRKLDQRTDLYSLVHHVRNDVAAAPHDAATFIGHHLQHGNMQRNSRGVPNSWMFSSTPWLRVSRAALLSRRVDEVGVSAILLATDLQLKDIVSSLRGVAAAPFSPARTQVMTGLLGCSLLWSLFSLYVRSDPGP